MNGKQFWALIKQAHGLEEPAVGQLFVEEAGDRLVYDCWLIDFGIKVSVPFPKKLAQLHMASEERDHRQYRTEKVKTVEIFIYALAKLEKLPQDVQQHMTRRFGKYLPEMQDYARKSWNEIETFDERSWAGF